MLRNIKSNIISTLVIMLLGFMSLVAESKIVILGDSLTKGHGVAMEDAFPALLEEMLQEKGYDVRVINAGISGSTTSGGLSRLEWVMQQEPEIVVLALGANDGLRGRPVEKMRENLHNMIVYAKEHNAKVVLAGMKLPMSYGKVYREEYEAAFSSLAEEHNLVFIPFLLEGIAGDRKLNLADGIHPNEDGHRVMANNVYKYVEPLL